MIRTVVHWGLNWGAPVPRKKPNKDYAKVSGSTRMFPDPHTTRTMDHEVNSNVWHKQNPPHSQKTRRICRSTEKLSDGPRNPVHHRMLPHVGRILIKRHLYPKPLNHKQTRGIQIAQCRRYSQTLHRAQCRYCLHTWIPT